MNFPDDVPTLTDGTVTLRATALSDVDAMVEQCVDPESVAWTKVPHPYRRADAVTFATEIVPAGWRNGTEYAFAIEAEHADGARRFAGSVSLRVHEESVAELAYGLHPGVRGHGVCSRAVRLVLDWGFAERGFAVVIWYANTGNWASRRVAWASGFSIDGTIESFLEQRGERRDAWVGSLRAGDERSPRHPWHVSPVLESDRLRLRPFADADADRLTEIARDPRTRHFAGRTSGIDRDSIDGNWVITRRRDSEARGERFNWGIADRDTDRLFGDIQLFDLGGMDDTSARLGYSMHQDSRGRGVLTEALGMVTEWAFRPVGSGGLGKRRLSLGTAASNKASRYAAEQAGFLHVATEPEAFTAGETAFDDLCVYHRLNPAWTPS